MGIYLIDNKGVVYLLKIAHNDGKSQPSELAFKYTSLSALVGRRFPWFICISHRSERANGPSRANQVK
jgi:hypothetical protein